MGGGYHPHDAPHHVPHPHHPGPPHFAEPHRAAHYPHPSSLNEIKGELVKIYPKADPRYLLTVEGDSVVLSKGSEHDSSQQWYKDDSPGERLKDDSGHPTFVLVNKASHLALRHSTLGKEHKDQKDVVTLVPYREDDVDRSTLWSLSDDLGDGYRTIRPADNTKLNLDADHADKEHGGVKEHNRVILYKWNKQENQKWKLVPL